MKHLYRTPFLKRLRDDKYFDNKMTEKKNDNINVYPTTSIFEFLSKLNKIIVDSITDGRKVCVSMNNPRNIRYGSNLVSSIDFSKYATPDIFLFGSIIQLIFSRSYMNMNRFGTLLLNKLNDQSIKINRFQDYFYNILIYKKEEGSLFKSYLTNCVTSIKPLLNYYVIENKKIPISLKFNSEIEKVYIISEKVGDDLTLLTWSHRKTWEDCSLRTDALAFANTKPEDNSKKKEAYDQYQEIRDMLNWSRQRRNGAGIRDTLEPPTLTRAHRVMGTI